MIFNLYQSVLCIYSVYVPYNHHLLASFSAIIIISKTKYNIVIIQLYSDQHGRSTATCYDNHAGLIDIHMQLNTIFILYSKIVIKNSLKWDELGYIKPLSFLEVLW